MKNLTHMCAHALGAAALAALLAAPASAVTCSGTGCTNQSPSATGCLDDGIWVTASPVLVGGNAIGYVHLMWSATCETVWSRLSTYSLQGSGSGYWSYLSNGGLNFAYQIGAPGSATYAYDEVIDTSLAYHLDSLMYHKSESRVTNGVKACSRITGVANEKCTVLVDPDDI